MFVACALMALCYNGIQTICSKDYGAEDWNAFRRHRNAGYGWTLLLMAALALLFALLRENILDFLGANDADMVVARLCRECYTMFLPCFLLQGFFCIASCLLFLEERRQLVIANIILYVCTITGNILITLNRPSMTAYIAMNALSEAAADIYLAAYFLRRRGSSAAAPNTLSFRLADAAEIMRAGSPVLLNQAFFTLRTFLLNQILLGLAGNPAVAAFAVFTTLSNLIFSIAAGAGSVMLMLSSIFYNEEDKSSLQSLIGAMIPYALTLVTVAVVLAEVLSAWLIRLFLGSNPAILALAIPGLRLSLIGMIPNVLNNVVKCYFQGIQHTLLTNVIAFLQSVGLTVVCARIFSLVFGLTGFWIGTVIGQLLTTLVIAILVWRKYGAVSFSNAAFSYLAPDFGAKPEDCMELAVGDVTAAAAASEKLCDFCREKGIEPRTAMLIGLCVEEMTINVIEHGFTKDKHSHNVDVRLVIEEDKRIVRIRDNCVNFDPTKYLELHRSDDPVAHIGLRMVMGMVKEANYINTLGLNNLTLIL